jgi:hypothetical protein
MTGFIEVLICNPDNNKNTCFIFCYPACKWNKQGLYCTKAKGDFE